MLPSTVPLQTICLVFYGVSSHHNIVGCAKKNVNKMFIRTHISIKLCEEKIHCNSQRTPAAMQLVTLSVPLRNYFIQLQCASKLGLQIKQNSLTQWFPSFHVIVISSVNVYCLCWPSPSAPLFSPHKLLWSAERGTKGILYIVRILEHKVG